MTLTETEKLTATLATQILVAYMPGQRSYVKSFMMNSVAHAKKIIELSREPKPETKPATGRRIRQWPSDQ